ncbi:MAG: TlpA family protein disulfide reductase [Myxococcota bacterium]
MNWKYLIGGLAVVGPLVAVLAAGFGQDPRHFESPLVGKPAPDFALRTLDGEEVDLADLKGRKVVLNFWATWCVPCQQEHPVLLAGAARHPDTAFYGVVYQDEPGKIRAWLERHGSAYPTLVDEGSKVALAYGVYGVPETYLIDPSGVIRHKFVGPVDAATLNAQLEAM